MKTKILLSITMLAMIFNTNANDEISMDSIRYAIQHPITSIVIASQREIIVSSDWLWETIYTTNSIVIYDATIDNFSPIFTKKEKSQTSLCLTGIFFFIAGLVFSFLGIYREKYLISLPIIIFLALIFINENIYWWLPIIIVICFFVAGWFGYHLKKRKERLENDVNPLGCV